MIGDIVCVTVDRPLGSYHPVYKDMYYPINYGLALLILTIPFILFICKVFLNIFFKNP